MIGELRIMGRQGDARLLWNSDIPEEVIKVKAQFEEAMKRKCLAFEGTPDGSPGKRITEFNPLAERIVIIPQLAGGA